MTFRTRPDQLEGTAIRCRASPNLKSLRLLSVLCGSAVNVFKRYHRKDAEVAEINAEKTEIRAVPVAGVEGFASTPGYF